MHRKRILVVEDDAAIRRGLVDALAFAGYDTLEAGEGAAGLAAAIGFPVMRYRLACFVIAGTMCGLAGALLANNTDFVSPAVMFWTRSGDLMVMVILGGMGSLFGPVIGAIVYLVLEEFLSQLTEYWALIMGPLLLLIVLFGRGGIMGLLGRLSRG